MENEEQSTSTEQRDRDRPDTKAPPSSPESDQQDLERGEEKLDRVIAK